MTRPSCWQKISLGIKLQIVSAVGLTVCALVGLTTVLAAGQVRSVGSVPVAAAPSAGTVVTSMSDFHTARFAAAAFNDWD